MLSFCIRSEPGKLDGDQSGCNSRHGRRERMGDFLADDLMQLAFHKRHNKSFLSF